MQIIFSDLETKQPESLAYKMGLSGRVIWLEATSCRITAEDNEPEWIPVHIAVKRRKVIYDTDRQTMPLYGRLQLSN